MKCLIYRTRGIENLQHPVHELWITRVLDVEAPFVAAILAIFISVVQKNPAQGVVLGVLALVIYVPMSYYTDRALWRRRMRQKQQSSGRR